jgi:hypothetical protein
MNKLKKLASTIALGAMSAGGVAIMAGTASASTTPAHAITNRSLPKVQENGMDGNWRHEWRVRPGYIAFGADYIIERIRWSSWTQHSAYGRGHLIACAGASGPCHNGVVDIHLYSVFSHSGPGRNFGNLQYSGSHYKHLWIGSAGSWDWS